MLGFIKKDILVLKKGLLLNLVLFLSVSYLLKNDIFLSALWVSLQTLSMVLFTFSEDSKSNFFAYISGLHNGKKLIVVSKYITYLLYFAIVIFLNFFIRKMGNSNIFINEILLMGFLSFFISTCLFSIIVPFVFKFDRDKGIMVLFTSIFFIFVFIILMSKFVNFSKFEILRKISESFSLQSLQSLNYSIYFIITIITIIIMFISYLLSAWIVRIKEF